MSFWTPLVNPQSPQEIYSGKQSGLDFLHYSKHILQRQIRVAITENFQNDLQRDQKQCLYRILRCKNLPLETNSKFTPETSMGSKMISLGNSPLCFSGAKKLTCADRRMAWWHLSCIRSWPWTKLQNQRVVSSSMVSQVWRLAGGFGWVVMVVIFTLPWISIFVIFFGFWMGWFFSFFFGSP